MADQEIPQMLEELFSAAPPPKRDEPTENPSATLLRRNGGDADPGARRTGRASRVGYRTIPPPQPPRMSMFTLIGIFSLVVAAVVTVGRVVLRPSRDARAPQSSSARSVSTSR